MKDVVVKDAMVEDVGVDAGEGREATESQVNVRWSARLRAG
jgi:hypothetical protein